jgi:hypothetical protein
MSIGECTKKPSLEQVSRNTSRRDAKFEEKALDVI